MVKGQRFGKRWGSPGFGTIGFGIPKFKMHYEEPLKRTVPEFRLRMTESMLKTSAKSRGRLGPGIIILKKLFTEAAENKKLLRISFACRRSGLGPSTVRQFIRQFEKQTDIPITRKALAKQ